MNIAFVIDRFSLGSPEQQLLDRFLVGYHSDGVFHPNRGNKITVPKGFGNELIQKRVADFGLGFNENARSAEAIVIFSSAALMETINAVKSGTPIFVHGAIASDAVRLAKERNIPLMGGTVTSTALRLPEIKPPGKVRNALIIVQGPELEAELTALDGILPFVNGEVTRVRFLKKAAVLHYWKPNLVEAALSRSDSPQGFTLEDGRSDNFSKWAPQLAKEPRGWELEHANGAVTTLLVLDGAIADTVLAVDAGGKIFSTQLFKAPAPMREDFSRLVSVIWKFFESGKAEPELPLERSILEARLLSHFAKAQARDGTWRAVA